MTRRIGAPIADSHKMTIAEAAQSVGFFNEFTDRLGLGRISRRRIRDLAVPITYEEGK